MRALCWIAALPMIAAAGIKQSAADDNVALSVQPKKCVALRKGQKCYQKVKITFRAPGRGDYCLHISSREAPLACWQKVGEGYLDYVFNSDSSVQFLLYKDTDKLISESQFTVAWVYNNRSRRRSNWRLF